jgi:hypothetical protein
MGDSKTARGSGSPKHDYAPRRPTETILYAIVRDHLEAFLAHLRLATKLETLAPHAVAEVDGSSQEVRLRRDTLWIDTDRGTASLVWRGNVRLAHPAQAGRVMVTLRAGSAVAVAAPAVGAPPAAPIAPANLEACAVWR